MPVPPSDPLIGGYFTGADGGDGPWLASPRSPPSAVSIGFLQTLIKRRLGVTLSLPARAVSGEDPSGLLA
jgi:hypothetical protein